MSKKRKRGQNFSIEEKDKLVKIVFPHKDAILNKKTDGPSNELKYNAWNTVTNVFNSWATVNRSKESLMKVWEKLKSESKLYYNKRSSTETISGPCTIKICPIMEQVCAILGRDGIITVADSDAEYSEFTKVFCSENFPTIEDQTSETDETPAGEPKNKGSSYNTNRNDLSKMEVNLEYLKVQLLQDEIKFKKQLYQLQLLAAKKDVEIKTEILSQIKGGAFSLQSLFGVPQRNE